MASLTPYGRLSQGLTGFWDTTARTMGTAYSNPHYQDSYIRLRTLQDEIRRQEQSRPRDHEFRIGTILVKFTTEQTRDGTRYKLKEVIDFDTKVPGSGILRVPGSERVLEYTYDFDAIRKFMRMHAKGELDTSLHSMRMIRMLNHYYDQRLDFIGMTDESSI